MRQITNTREVPWKRIVHLAIEAADGMRFQGTGFLIGPCTIITAGHCVYSVLKKPARHAGAAVAMGTYKSRIDQTIPNNNDVGMTMVVMDPDN
jgi:V8-like Glu-specific endopeptidase